MTIFRRRRDAPQAEPHSSPFAFDPRAPERHGALGEERYGHQGFREALDHYGRAIDMMQSLYISESMRNRQPGVADAWIIDGYTSSLGATLAMDRTADVTESVRSVTGLLRSIVTACERVGVPSTLYRDGLESIGEYASHVNVDDVFW